MKHGAVSIIWYHEQVVDSGVDVKLVSIDEEVTLLET